MRKIIVFNRVTSDGLFAAVDGGLDWEVPDDDVNREAAAAMPGADTILFGRKTYQMFKSFWPTVIDDPNPRNPHHPAQRSPVLHDMAVWIHAATKIVLSSTLRDPGWHNTRVLPAFTPGAIDALKRAPGQAIMVFGSGSLVSLLAEHGLIDEYQLLVTPVLLGAGAPLFRGLSHRVPLALLEAKPYRSGNVMLRYAPRSA